MKIFSRQSQVFSGSSVGRYSLWHNNSLIKPSFLINELFSIFTKCFNAGILTVGGKGGRDFKSTAEIFNPISGRSCKIGDIPVGTDGLSLCGNLACGGWKSDKSCSRFDGAGTFTALSVTLKEERFYHLCWQLPSREVLLIGGSESLSTTERLASDGSSSSSDFALPYDIRFVLNPLNIND